MIKGREFIKEGDVQDLNMPDLRKNPTTLLFITAALNGLVFDDYVSNKGTIKSLNTLFKENKLNEEGKLYIIPYIVSYAAEIKRGIPNKKEVFQFLISHGARGELLLLGKEIDFSLIEAVIEAGIDVNFTQESYSALHAIIVTPDTFDLEKKIKFLLNKGINPNFNHQNGTALHLAIANETFNDKESQFAAKALIRFLKDSKYKYDWNLQDKEGKTVLALAAKIRSKELVKEILSVHQTFRNVDVNKTDNQGRSPLHFAAALGDDDSVQSLIKAGAEINLKDKYGRTPLHYAVMREQLVKKILEEIHINPERDENALGNYLLGIDAKPARVFIRNKEVEIHATKNEVDAVVPNIFAQFEKQTFPSQELKEFDINFIKIQSSHLTGKPLIKACLENHVKVAEILIKNGAKLYSKNSQNNTPYLIVSRDALDTSSNTSFTDREVGKKIKAMMDNIIKESQELKEIGAINLSQDKGKWSKIIINQANSVVPEVNKNGPGYGF